MKYCSVYITVKNKEEARNMGHLLLEKRLVACVNIIDSVESLYWWKGKIEDKQEVIIIAKTKESAIAKLIQEVTLLHSDKNPCIVVWPIIDGNEEYLKWIESEVV